MIFCKDELDLLKDEKTYQDTHNRFDSIIRCNGYDPNTEKELSLKDALELPSASFMIPRVLTSFVQEGVEPLLETGGGEGAGFEEEARIGDGG